MDDLAVCLSGSTSDALIAKLGAMVGYLMDTFLGHAMTPNTAVGKTELLLSLRGSKSRAWKRRFHGPVSDQHFHVLGEHQCHSIKVTGRYCHLGGIIHHTGDLRAEARHRLAQAHQLFTRQRHVLFRNKYISGPVKSQIFDSVVLSRLNYGSETWVLSDQQTKHCIHSGIMKLYRRLLGCGPNAHLTDDEILIKCDEPSPTELLRHARLRYLGTLYQGARDMDWGIINQDQEWLTLVQDDCMWLWARSTIALLCRIPALTVQRGNIFCATTPPFGSAWSTVDADMPCSNVAIVSSSEPYIGAYFRVCNRVEPLVLLSRFMRNPWTTRPDMDA